MALGDGSSFRVGEHSPRTAWSAPFALILIVAAVEVLFLLYLMVVGPGAHDDLFFLLAFHDFWTAGGLLERGLPFEVMKVNVLLAVFAWVASRRGGERADRMRRFALVGGALLLLTLQLGLAASYELLEPRYVLTLLEP